jgi:tetratricopeptide (TPR) repeat protein
LQRACRGDLDVIVGQALKKYPDERYRTVADFAADVRRHLNNEPVLAQADAWRYRARKFVSRHRLEVAAAFAVALALAAGTGIAMRQASVSAAERDRALASLRRAEATNDLSAFLLSEARPAGKPISNAELLARGEAVVQTRYSDADDLKVHLLLTLADRYQENQQFNEMTRVVGQAYDASRQLTDRALRAYATCYSSFPLVERGDLKGALVILDQALTELSTAPDASEYEGACRVMESVAARRGGDGARAIRAAERAVAIEERGAGSGRRVQEALLALAAAYAFDLRHGAAAATYQRLVSIFEAEGRADTANAAVMFNNWSTGLQDAGLPLQAVGPSERAVRTARAADSENGASMTLLNTYATALVAVGRYDEARPLLDEAIVKARKAGAPPRLRLLLSNAATAAAEAGEIERAQRLAAEAASLSRSPSERAIAQRTEATLAEVSGRRRDAAQLAGRAFEMLTAAGASKVTRMRTQIDLARIQNGDGQFADALTAAESALAAAKDALGDLPRSSHVGRALLEIAAARCGLGDTATARSTLSLALDHLQSTTGTQSAATRRAEAVRRALDQNVPGCTP